jgi:hypothetical protein
MEKSPRSFRIGLVIHGKRIWLSEFLSIFSVSIISVCLLSISFLILLNEIRIKRSDREIARLRIERVVTDNKLEHLRGKNRIALLLCSFSKNKVPSETVYNLAEIVYVNSRQFGYDPLLLLSVINVESFFNPEAKGKFRSGNLSGALGLMQLKFETAQSVARKLKMGEIRKEDLLKPEINLVLGVAYLTELISRFSSFKLGLMAYNLGPGAVRESLAKKESLPLEYYRKVLKAYYELKNISNRSAALQYPSGCR